MLSKLIKYDIRSTWRDFTGIYLAIILGVILVPLIFNNINNEIIQVTAGFVAFAICITVVVITILSLFKIFNVNIFSKEGYLTMTLPVTARQIVTSKLLVSTMWIILTGIVSCFGLFLFAVISSPELLNNISLDFSDLFALIGGKGVFTIFILVISVIVSAVKEIAKLFLACSIAHLKQLNRFRIPAGIISYFVFSWLETVIVQIIAFIVGLMSDNAQNWFDQLEASNDISTGMNIFNGVMGVGIIYAILLTAAFSSATIWILNHKLELD